jgi:hypothetical protein
VRGNVPHVAERVLYARHAIPIGLVLRLCDRGGSCVKRTLIYCVDIVYIGSEDCLHDKESFLKKAFSEEKLIKVVYEVISVFMTRQAASQW